jgi:hypothetical protein
MTRQTPARLSYFVFSKSAGARQCENIIQRVRDTRSGALQEPGNAGSPGSG